MLGKLRLVPAILLGMTLAFKCYVNAEPLNLLGKIKQIPSHFKSSEPNQGTKQHEYSDNPWRDNSSPQNQTAVEIRTPLVICQEKYQTCMNRVNYERAAKGSGSLSAFIDSAKYTDCKIARSQCLKSYRQ